jgi:purine-binding chemotaxis protein CheW
MTKGSAIEKESKARKELENTEDFLTMIIADQIFGIPILQVQDVLGPHKVTKVPLSPPAVAGSLNLRGRIVTSIDVRVCLGLPPKEKSNADDRDMSIVVEHNNELYSLKIDEIGDVMGLHERDYERNPATLAPLWRSVSAGIYRLENKLLVVFDIPKLLETIN